MAQTAAKQQRPRGGNGNGVERRLTAVETGLAVVNSRLDGMAEVMATREDLAKTNARLDSMDSKMATREDLAKVNARLDGMDSRMDGMATREDLAKVNARLDVMATREDLERAVKTMLKWQIGILLAVMGLMLPLLMAVIAALTQIVQLLAQQ